MSFAVFLTNRPPKMIHPCRCTDYNGGQCYNCLNGAHSFCPTCGKKNAKHMGLRLIIKPFKAKKKVGD